MPAREKALDRRIVSLLRSRGAWYLKTQPPNRPGVPDFVVCYKGFFLGVESKAEDGIVSKIQKYELGQIGDAGGIALVARGDTDALETWLNTVDSMAATGKTLGKLDRGGPS